ncbi:MAG TPA: phytanoyl-CoA dioxygenase family protein [Capsulimonadaceae bacterium]|jgi:ectoine hydroxylase-related dioxygenase (phytanoyl-CoA dioxygenase family)
MYELNPEHNIDDIIAEIDTRGYCVIPSVITPAEADTARAALDELLAAERTPEADRTRSQRVWRLATKNPLFLDLMCHPLIVALWQRYLGNDVICSTWTANTILPGCDAVGWHADFPYWSMAAPWPEGRLATQTIWMLDDFTDENGATGVEPYSHKMGRSPGPADTHETAQIATATRGSVLVAHGAFWHTARPNRTAQPRSALLGMYMRPCFITQEDMRSQIAEIDSPSPIARQLLCENQYQSKK